MMLATSCGLWSPAPARLPNSGLMAIGETRTAYNVSTHCGVRYLDVRIAQTDWVAVDLDVEGLAPMPASWREEVGDDERIDLVVELLSVDQLRATAIGSDEALNYAPATEPGGCD